MSLPLVQRVFVTEDCVCEWKSGNPNIKVSEPVPLLRFLYELCWTMVQGELSFQKCKVALDSVIFSEKASTEKLASNFADIVTQMVQDVSIRHLGPSTIQQMQHPCNECKGTGETIDDRDRCPQCKGEKVIQEKKALEVIVEKGQKIM